LGTFLTASIKYCLLIGIASKSEIIQYSFGNKIGMSSFANNYYGLNIIILKIYNI